MSEMPKSALRDWLDNCWVIRKGETKDRETRDGRTRTHWSSAHPERLLLSSLGVPHADAGSVLRTFLRTLDASARLMDRYTSIRDNAPEIIRLALDRPHENGRDRAGAVNDGVSTTPTIPFPAQRSKP